MELKHLESRLGAWIYALSKYSKYGNNNEDIQRLSCTITGGKGKLCDFYGGYCHDNAKGSVLCVVN